MIARQCFKLRSSYRQVVSYYKITLPTSCLNSTNRLLATQHSGKTLVTNEIFVSGGPMNKVPSGTANRISRLSPEDLLEKLIAGLSTDIHQKNRVYKNDFIRVIDKIKDLNMSSKKQRLLLIKCCTELMPDETPSTRLALVEQVLKVIKSHTKLDVDYYNELLRVYIANNKKLVVGAFIGQMDSVKPNITTFELILRTLGEAGDINQCTEVLSNMKAQGLPATENVFNSLIICHGKSGNLDNIQEILTMMNSLKLEFSVNTYTTLARVYAWNKNNKQLILELRKATDKGIIFGETHVMDIVKTLATAGNYAPIPQVLKFLPVEILETPSITPVMQSVSTLLVFQNHPMAALEIYKCLPLPSFGPKDDKGLHGRSLIRDCVKASTPSNVIALIAQELMSSGRNTIALQNASEAALQLGKVPLALDFFIRMKQYGMAVRPHYFWPILIHTSRSYGEKGIMNTLSTMVDMEVKPDYETIMEYTLPYVSFTSPQNLMKKFQDVGLTVSDVLTPMMVTLLNTGQVRSASEICELFEGKVNADLILKPFLKGYFMSSDMKSTIHILEDVTKKALNKDKDWVGRFLCVFMKHNKVKEDLSDILNIIKALQEKNITISTSAADYCISLIPEQHKKLPVEGLKEALINITDETLVDEGDMFGHQIPHPKQMTEEALKAHLVELEAKNLNTRGVLRKLLQHYCRVGDLAAAGDMLHKCEHEGVFLSAGMKASIFDLHVKRGELDLAEAVAADLNRTAPNFILDDYKVIDLATLMVREGKIQRAFELIDVRAPRRRAAGAPNVASNCRRLLDALAAAAPPGDLAAMLRLLDTRRYCPPTNTLLGPLVRVHLESGNLDEAVREFVNLADKYKKTPLKQELLCKILRELGEGKSEDNFIANEKSNSRLNKSVRTVLDVIRRVHGAGDVQLTLVAALAEVGYKKSLRKLFLEPGTRLHPDALLRLCERFSLHQNTHALHAIADTAKDLRNLDISEIYNLILDVHQRKDNCEEALSLFYKMQENDIVPSQKFLKNICSFLKTNHRQIPSDLALLLDKHTKMVSNEAA